MGIDGQLVSVHVLLENGWVCLHSSSKHQARSGLFLGFVTDLSDKNCSAAFTGNANDTDNVPSGDGAVGAAGEPHERPQMYSESALLVIGTQGKFTTQLKN